MAIANASRAAGVASSGIRLPASAERARISEVSLRVSYEPQVQWIVGSSPFSFSKWCAMTCTAGRKLTGVRGVNSPAKTRDCPHCGKAMDPARTVPGFGVLPELNIFRCAACDEAFTVVESATSLVQVPVELGFI